MELLCLLYLIYRELQYSFGTLWFQFSYISPQTYKDFGNQVEIFSLKFGRCPSFQLLILKSPTGKNKTFLLKVRLRITFTFLSNKRKQIGKKKKSTYTISKLLQMKLHCYHALRLIVGVEHCNTQLCTVSQLFYRTFCHYELYTNLI